MPNLARPTPLFVALTLLATPAFAQGASATAMAPVSPPSLPAVSAPGCRDVKAALAILGNPDKDYDLRTNAGSCLVRTRLDQAEVNRVVLSILRDPSEDTLLREDLIAAFADANLRRKVHVEGRLAPALGKEERDAVDRALSGVGSLLAAAEAVKSIEETVPSCRFEPDYFRVFSDIALDESSHVLLRAAAVNALETVATKVYDSGSFDEKLLGLARETLRTVAGREDDASYFTNAGSAYNHLAVAGLPGFSREPLLSAGGGRMLSSVKSSN